MRRSLRLLLVLAVLAGTTAVGVQWYRGTDRADGLQAQDQGQEPARVPGRTVARLAVRLSGSLEAREVAVASQFGGRIVAIAVEAGDAVEEGQVLVELDTTSLQAEIAQAEAAVTAEQASLAFLRAGAHPAEVLAAEAALQHAAAERAKAESAFLDALKLLDDPQEVDLRIAQAEAELALARVQIEEAESRVAAAEAMRERYRAQGSLQEKGLYAVHSYQLRAAESALEASKARRRGALSQLDALEALRARPLAVLGQVHLAEARLRMEEAGVQVAKARLHELRAGPAPEEVAVSEARVRRSEAALAALRVQGAMMVVRSPTAGTVVRRPVEPGEIALPGQTLITVADLDDVWLTIYIPQADLGRVQLGMEGRMVVDAYPDLTFAGRVTFVSPHAEFSPSNVQTAEDRLGMVFEVRLRVPNGDRLLRSGMPVEIALEGG